MHNVSIYGGRIVAVVSAFGLSLALIAVSFAPPGAAVVTSGLVA